MIRIILLYFSFNIILLWPIKKYEIISKKRSADND